MLRGAWERGDINLKSSISLSPCSVPGDWDADLAGACKEISTIAQHRDGALGEPNQQNVWGLDARTFSATAGRGISIFDAISMSTICRLDQR